MRRWTSHSPSGRWTATGWASSPSMRSPPASALRRRTAGPADLTISLAPMSVLFGRFLQLIGMIILPVGLLMGLLRDEIQLEVRLLFIGGAFFVIGWLLARKGQQSAQERSPYSFHAQNRFP